MLLFLVLMKEILLLKIEKVENADVLLKIIIVDDKIDWWHERNIEKNK